VTAYYNEIDPAAAQWLRNLIAAGHIAPGDVDERSIEDVAPDDLINYTQHHFFAGVGVWSYALRRAGWPDDLPVWTGSCPCQPFSSAGKRGGFDDERHLWPHFHWLIEQCRPSVVFGEQVASKAVEPWIDLVQADVEALGYAFGCIPFPSAGVGAPMLRDRAFWVADAQQHGHTAQEQAAYHRQSEAYRPTNRASGRGLSLGDLGQPSNNQPQGPARDEARLRTAGREGFTDRVADSAHQFGNRSRTSGEEGRIKHPISSGIGGMGYADSESSQRHPGGICSEKGKSHCSRRDDGSLDNGHSDAGRAIRLGNAERDGLRSGGRQAAKLSNESSDRALLSSVADSHGRNARIWQQRLSTKDGGSTGEGNNGIRLITDGNNATGPTNGFWRDADWLFCRDGKWRPVEPGTSPLANVTSERVGRMQPRLAGLGFSESDIKRILGRRSSTLADAGRNRVTRLKGYGNAINAEAAAAFIEAFIEARAVT